MRRIALIIIISLIGVSLGWGASSRLIATEEEVKQFLEQYRDRYVNKDLEGFLMLFSPRAIQNQKEDREEIRKIYSRFFDQSLTLQYQLDELKIELYENAAEVKARYQIEQIRKEGGEKRSWRGSIRWVLGREGGTLKILSLDYQHQKTP